MAYTPTVWVNDDSPDLTADNLNHIETGIQEAQSTADECYQDFNGFQSQISGSSGASVDRITPWYVGQAYFDTDLGKPIWCSSLDPVTWVDATGTDVTLT